MATAPLETNDEFDAAFASFAAGNADPTPDPAPAADGGDGASGASDPDPAADPAGADPGGDGAGDPGAVADGGTGSDAGGSDPDPDAGEPAAAAPDATDDLINRLAAAVRAAPEPKVEEPAPVAAAAPEPEPDLYTPEEQQFLVDYDKDWSDVTKGEALKRRAEYRAIVGHVFNQVAEQLRPLLETVEVLSTRTQLADLRSTVGEDYDTLRDKVIDWATSDQHPAYLQNAYKEVIQRGTVEEVNDLVTRYRQATGSPAPAAVAAKKNVELSDDAKQAAQALAPVNTKRSAIPQSDDPNDYDSAFERWASAGKSR